MKKFNIIIFALISLPISAAEAPIKPEIEINESTSIQDLKNYILTRYNPSDAECGGGISIAPRKMYKEFRYNTAREFACLLLGKRKVLFASIQALKDALAQDPREYEIFERVANAENIKELDRYLFRPEGERNALLLIKSNIEGVGGDYLMGYLLGYKEDDIDFFHKRKTLSNLLPPSLSDFSVDQKNRFDRFIKDAWPQSEGFYLYEASKKRTHQWLEDNKRFSNEQLHQQIQQLKNRQK